MSEDGNGIHTGEGWSTGSLDDLGEGYGFRKVRRELDVTAFGVNAIVLPPEYETGRHYHDEQEELYFVHEGSIEIELDGEWHRLDPGGMARVAPEVHRAIRNVGDGDATYVIVGGKNGYVGRDGRLPEGETRGGPSGMDPDPERDRPTAG